MYVYGDYDRGERGQYIRTHTKITASLQEAFNECYIIGCDGLDYWLSEYDTDSDITKSLSITNPEFYVQWERAKQNANLPRANDAMRAAYV